MKKIEFQLSLWTSLICSLVDLFAHRVRENERLLAGRKINLSCTCPGQLDTNFFKLVLLTWWIPREKLSWIISSLSLLKTISYKLKISVMVDEGTGWVNYISRIEIKRKLSNYCHSINRVVIQNFIQILFRNIRKQLPFCEQLFTFYNREDND